MTMAADSYILVMNAGSSSLKFALFHGHERDCVGRGAATGIGTQAILKASGPFFENNPPPPLQENCPSPSEAGRVLIEWLIEALPEGALVGVGHRVLHGGDLTKTTIVRPYLLAYLKTLIPLAPLHQPFNLAIIEMLMESHPKVPQVACFDTAFHTTVPPLHTRFALPRVWHEKGVRRYGFHGLSYEYIAGRLKEVSPKSYGNHAIIAHLGNGASLCGIDHGRSFATTMGFTVLDGLMMGTRPGNLDPGVMLYFMREAKLDAASIERMLYHDSGLRGVSGISNDMAVLLKSDEQSAREAIDLFCWRIIREIGGMASLLGGTDAIVFTGGVGENAHAIRMQVGNALAWMGVTLDPEKSANAPRGEDALISTPDSKIEVWVLPTNEEAVIARHTEEVIEAQG